MRWRPLALGLVVLLVGGEALVWRWAVGRVERGLVEQSAQWRAQGWRVTSGAPQRGGWPFHARLSVPDLALAGDGLAWSAPRVVLDVALFDPRRLVVGLAGVQHLRLAGGPAIPITAERARITVPLTPGAPAERLDLAVSGLAAGPPQAVLRARHLTLALAARPATATLTADALTLPPAPGGRAWALGAEVARVALTARFSGQVPAAGDRIARATAWRDSGGALTLSDLALRWGPLDLAGEARLTLDQALQPTGTARLRLAGQGPTLDALAAGGVLSAPAARTAKAVLALLATAPKPGAPAEVDVPLTLKDRVLAMGQIPLARLPRLVWPDLLWSTTP